MGPKLANFVFQIKTLFSPYHDKKSILGSGQGLSGSVFMSHIVFGVWPL